MASTIAEDSEGQRGPGPSVLDDLGAEITGIAFPVSICMTLTIALVRLLDRNDDDDRSRVIIAEALYGEREGDSAGTKLGGSIINALVFVAAITVMTFVIVLLFKYGCVKIIYGYMGFATFLIFFFMTGGIFIDVLQTLDIHFDAFSLGFVLYNFAIVGPMVLFFQPAPLFMKQVYLMWTGVVVAFVFSSIPEVTTWVLLGAMSLYDLVAVLTPRGPLQMLVNLAIERDQDIPALVYEAREVRRPRARAPAAPVDAAPTLAAGMERTEAGPVAEGQRDEADEASLVRPEGVFTESGHVEGSDGEAMPTERTDGGAAEPIAQLDPAPAAGEDFCSPAPEAPAGASEGSAPPPRRRLPGRDVERQEDDADDPYQLGIPSGVKLGLGDFIFYSVLVGRASLYDWLTVYAAFISVISGLGITLWLLAVAKKALPALPVSIGLGIAFYFLTRWALEPFVVPAFLTMAYW